MQLINLHDEHIVLGKVTFKSNALQYCITPQKSYYLCYLVTFYGK